MGRFVLRCPDIASVVVAPAGFEPTAYGLGNRRSILLSYGAIWRIFNNFRLFSKTNSGPCFYTLLHFSANTAASVSRASCATRNQRHVLGLLTCRNQPMEECPQPAPRLQCERSRW